ncbi:TPA: acyltransferase [Serratia marcescens]|nr:acyltransferase [Serratia marcescens]
MQISKEKSELIKGIAIVMMLFHHLFGYPSRIASNIEVQHLFESFDIEFNVGGFCKICVPIFLFISGYGFSSRLKDGVGYLYVVGELKSIYFSYWIVLAIFLSIGFVFVKGEKYTLNMMSLLGDVSGLTSNYNDEWWFFKLYVMNLLALPVLLKIKSNYLLISTIPMMLVGKFFFVYGGAPQFIVEFLVSIFPFAAGLVFGRVAGGVEDSKIISSGINKISLINPFILLVISIIAYKFGKTMGLMLASPLFVIFLCRITDRVKGVSENVLRSLGRHSLYMWLTHSFYCYYFTQEFIYYPKYPVVILVWLVAISYVTSIIISYFERGIYRALALIK